MKSCMRKHLACLCSTMNVISPLWRGSKSIQVENAFCYSFEQLEAALKGKTREKLHHSEGIFLVQAQRACCEGTSYFLTTNLRIRLGSQCLGFSIHQALQISGALHWKVKIADISFF